MWAKSVDTNFSCILNWWVFTNIFSGLFSCDLKNGVHSLVITSKQVLEVEKLWWWPSLWIFKTIPLHVSKQASEVLIFSLLKEKLSLVSLIQHLPAWKHKPSATAMSRKEHQVYSINTFTRIGDPQGPSPTPPPANQPPTPPGLQVKPEHLPFQWEGKVRLLPDTKHRKPCDTARRGQVTHFPWLTPLKSYRVFRTVLGLVRGVTHVGHLKRLALMLCTHRCSPHTDYCRSGNAFPKEVDLKWLLW